MKWDEFQELKERQAELVKWKRQAEAYARRYGESGSLESREKHISRLAQAERELPEVERKLRTSWVDL